jgi:hypothetical protein
MRRATPPTRAATRSFISAAALLVNVIARIENGDASRSAIRYARRWVSTRVLPDPAPAITSTGPTGSVTASCCAGLSPSRSRRPKPRLAPSGACSGPLCGASGALAGGVQRVLAGSIIASPIVPAPTDNGSHTRSGLAECEPPVPVLHVSRMRCTCSTREPLHACNRANTGARSLEIDCFFPDVVPGIQEGKAWRRFVIRTPSFIG